MVCRYKIILALLVGATLGLSACAKKEGGAVRVAGRQQGLTGPQVTPQGGTHQCTSAQTTTGKIFDAAGNSALFENQVKSFVSATMDPQQFGSISGVISDRTGVDMVGTFTFDSAGQLVTGQSAVLIKIFDSLVGQVYNGETIPPYTIQFSTAASGSIDRATKQFAVKFADSYGEIVFQGRFDNSSVNGITEGTVSYTNYTAVSGFSPASGTLGSFRAYTCALIAQ